MKAMRPAITMLFATLCCSGLVPHCTAQNAAASTTIRTDFHPLAILSPNDLDSVVKLANQCGVPHVTEVHTYNIHPGSSFGITVKGEESVRGREVSFVNVYINRDSWRPNLRRPENPSLGEFSVQLVHTNKLTTFNVGNRSIRVRLGTGVAVPTADRIVEAFAAGKVTYADKTASERLKGINLSEPVEIAVNRIFFSCGKHCHLAVEFTLEADGVVVNRVFTMMA